MTTEDKIQVITRAVNFALQQSEFGSADLSIIRVQCYRHGVDEDDMQQYLATQVAAGYIKHVVIGRSAYIIPITN